MEKTTETFVNPRTDTDVDPSVIDVLLVDDQDIVRQGFRAALESDPGIRVVGEATTSAEAIRATRWDRPQVVLTEAHLLSPTDLGVLRQVGSANGVVPKIVIVTTMDSDECFLRYLKASVSGFLLKRIKPEELVRAIYAIIDGGAIIAPEMTRRLIDNFEINRPFATATFEASTPLSGRELEVLRCIAAGRSNREIARDLHLSETTVKSHVSRVLRKLGLRDRLQAASMVYRA